MKTPLLVGLGIAGVSLILPSVAESAPVATSIVANALQTTVIAVTGQLQTLAIKWLSIFMLAQFLITNLGLLKSGADIEAVWGKFAGSLMWFGFCFYLVENGAEFIRKVGGQMFMEAGTIAGAPGIFTTGNVFDWGLRLSEVLMVSVNKANGDGWFPTLDFLPSLLTFVSCLIILAVSALIGFKIFVIKIELMITVMMTPLSFSFMPLSAMKDQGMAPFKSLISLIYRVMILAVIVSAMDKTGMAIEAAFKSVGTGTADEIWSPVFAALMVFTLFGYLAFKSDSMAANLASGSTSLGTGDAATAAAAGAAAAAAVATGGAAAVGGGSKAVQAMGDFMKGLGGGGGAIKNASMQGSGGTAGTAPARPAVLSAGNGGFATNRSGAPVKQSVSSKDQGGGIGPSRMNTDNSPPGGQHVAIPVSGRDTQQATAGGAGASEDVSASGALGKSANEDRANTAAPPGNIGAGTPADNFGVDGRALPDSPSSTNGAIAPARALGPPAARAGGTASPSAPNVPGRRAPVRPALPEPAGSGTGPAAFAMGGQNASIPATQPSARPAVTAAAGDAIGKAGGLQVSAGPAVAVATGGATGKVGGPQVSPTVAVSAPMGPSAQPGLPTANSVVSPTEQGAPTSAPSGAPSVGSVPTGSGSGRSAGIAGPTSPLEQKVDKLLENAAQVPKRARPTLSDRLGTLNEHVARESAATHVSINVNAD